jgi:hypothetical protein
MEWSLVDNYRQKAHEARQRMERSPDPAVRRMWRDIAEQFDYLAGTAERGATLGIAPDAC